MMPAKRQVTYIMGNILPLYDDIDNIIGNINANSKKRIHYGVR